MKTNEIHREQNKNTPLSRILKNFSYILKMMDVDLDLEMETIKSETCPECGCKKKAYKIMCAKCNIPMKRMLKRYHEKMKILDICCQDSVNSGIFVCKICEKTLTTTIITNIRLREFGLL